MKTSIAEKQEKKIRNLQGQMFLRKNKGKIYKHVEFIPVIHKC